MIYQLCEGNESNQLKCVPFSSEGELQEVIANTPEILLRESDEGNTLYLVERELTLPGTFVDATDLSLDHFMVDKNGVPVLVEVKQVSNPEIRRKVVGQMLEYATRVSYYDSTELQDMYERNNDNPIDNPREFWRTVSSNLRCGHLRLIFAADTIPNTLKAIIEYLDRSMSDIDVYGVEIKKHIAEDGKVYLTRNIIQNIAKSANVQMTAKSRWTDSDVQEYLMSDYKGDWAFTFFENVQKKAAQFGYEGKYGNGETYIPYRYHLKKKYIFAFDVNTRGKGAGLYFNTKNIYEVNNAMTFDVVLEKLKAIDPDPHYTKEKKPVHLRTRCKYYNDPTKQELLYRFMAEIADTGSR